MKTRQLFFLFCIMTIITGISCKKTGFTDSPTALLLTSENVLHFDTVFTSTGSITQSFKIFNRNDRQLRISSIELAGGAHSFFSINVDGASGTFFSNIDIAPNDSIYVFVAVTIHPDNSTNLFLIADSIRILYNTNEAFVQLDAYGQNAHFFSGATVTKDTTWRNALPFVISGNLHVMPGATLTIEKGTKIYCHADATFLVNGTMKAAGEKYDSTRIVFRSDRLDEYYRDLPAGWQGIVFTETSVNNQLDFVSVLNATNAIVVRNPSLNSAPKLALAQCRIDNAANAGIYGIYSSIDAVNCLISNCGNNIKFVAGGNYHFNNCTAASYSNLFLTHQNPVLYINDVDDNNQVFPLTALFTNCIFWGDDGIVADEIVLEQTGSTLFNASFENVLYKGNAGTGNFSNALQNENPYFRSIDVLKYIFDFRLQDISPCIDKGKTGITSIDLNGNARTGGTDIGCYEYIP